MEDGERGHKLSNVASRSWKREGDRLSRKPLGRMQPSRRIFGEDNGTPLQYSCLENHMDGRAW